MTPDIRVVIPARYASTRLPAKPLALIGGVPMIVRTAQQVAQAGFPYCVAYDDERIGDVLAAHHIPAIKTRFTHENGTQRLSEVVIARAWTDEMIVVNVQGDEPLLPPDLITTVARTLIDHTQASVATLATVCDAPESPNTVKVVCDCAGYALYFSRSVMPYVRDAAAPTVSYLRHIGIYAYRVQLLKRYPQLAPTPLEQAEKLEQLRFLEHGFKIAVAQIDEAPPAGVDSPEDLARVQALFNS